MNEIAVAYFSMEIAVDPAIPTYSGGLGILAGDSLRSGADLGIPMLGVTLLHRKGYLTQSFDPSGWQHELPVDWNIGAHLAELPQRATVRIEDRMVSVRAWRYEIKGGSGHVVPVLFLDSDLPENSAWDRTLTHFLYGGDTYYRLCQEMILGIGGLRMLRALGHRSLKRFHLNEGHASLLALALLDEDAKLAGRTAINNADIEAVRRRCIFTTHTPVAAGHDQFPMDLVGRVLGRRQGFLDTKDVFCAELIGRILQREPGTYDVNDIFRREYVLNLTYLALTLSHFVNGVAKRHAELSRRLFAKFHIDEITNGVHAATWTAPAFRALFDRHMPGWQEDNFSLRYALNIPPDELWEAHATTKRQLLDLISAKTGILLDPQALTLGVARRMTPYKRADLLLHDTDRLKAIAAKTGRLQIVFGGKAHPNDSGGKEIIQRIRRLRESLPGDVTVVYLENYDMGIAKLLTAGADIWVNTPLPPMEASGTSGMKAALNGVPSLSILDGWWLEGCVEGVTGWAIGNATVNPEADGQRSDEDAAALYDKLERVVLPLFYHDRPRFLEIMRHAIALNGSFFNTQRMMQQYVLKAYFA